MIFSAGGAAVHRRAEARYAAPVLYQWAVVVPVKELRLAKTRLVTVAADARAQLALAAARDVVTAALQTGAAVFVVTNDTLAAESLAADGAQVIADSADSGLNPALEEGARVASGWHPRRAIAALSSDLPALSPDELAEAFAAATAAPRCFVADHHARGTTLLTCLPGVPLAPRFGVGSRQQHLNSGALELVGEWPGLRCDLDTPADLELAAGGPLGRHTAQALRRLGPEH